MWLLIFSLSILTLTFLAHLVAAVCDPGHTFGVFLKKTGIAAIERQAGGFVIPVGVVTIMYRPGAGVVTDAGGGS
ncbi:MAG: hypothetical protein JW781_01160 [Deltaproteobacteria bacterium]|nr:hypothetical protein [Candidatus Anaeroferrophillacea bacterium]